MTCAASCARQRKTTRGKFASVDEEEDGQVGKQIPTDDD